MGRHIALVEDDASFRIEANGQEHGQTFAFPLSQLTGVLLNGYGVKIHERVEEGRILGGFVLQLHPLL